MFRIGAAVAVAALSAGVQAAAPSIDTATIESVTGLKGTYNKAENVFKVSKPRDDVKVSVDRWTMPPFITRGPPSQARTIRRWSMATSPCTRTSCRPC